MAEFQTPFMDRVHEWTFAAKANGRKISNEARQVTARYRAQLRRANRFVVDDEAVRLCCHLSHEIDRLESWGFLARLPHDVCWFEFNLHAKMQEFDRMGTLRWPFDPGEVSPVMGILIYKDDPPSPLWLAHIFTICHSRRYTPKTNGEVSPDVVSLMFNPEGNEMWPLRGSKIWRSPTLSLLPGFPGIGAEIRTGDGTVIHTTCSAELVMAGVMGVGGGETTVNRDAESGALYTADDSLITGMQWMTSRTAVIVDPFTSSELFDFKGTSLQEKYQHIVNAVKELRGMLRYLITMLAMINGLPLDTRPIATRPGRHTIGMHQLPYLGHSVINIKVPRDDRVVWARKALTAFGRNSARRWGPVRGHWRVIERGKSTHACRHMPTMVEAGLGMCEACELMIRWVEYPHGRGDPNVGVVDRAGYNIQGRADRLNRKVKGEVI